MEVTVPPTAEEIKEAMRNEASVEYEGKIYRKILGYCCRVSRPDVHRRRRLYAEVELLDKNERSVVVASPEKIKILERVWG